MIKHNFSATRLIKTNSCASEKPTSSNIMPEWYRRWQRMAATNSPSMQTWDHFSALALGLRRAFRLETAGIAVGPTPPLAFMRDNEQLQDVISNYSWVVPALLRCFLWLICERDMRIRFGTVRWAWVKRIHHRRRQNHNQYDKWRICQGWNITLNKYIKFVSNVYYLILCLLCTERNIKEHKNI